MIGEGCCLNSRSDSGKTLLRINADSSVNKLYDVS